jgi:hypothetical protein
VVRIPYYLQTTIIKRLFGGKYNLIIKVVKKQRDTGIKL